MPFYDYAAALRSAIESEHKTSVPNEGSETSPTHKAGGTEDAFAVFSENLSTLNVRGIKWDVVKMVQRFDDVKTRDCSEVCEPKFGKLFHFARRSNHCASFVERLYETVGPFLDSPFDIWSSILDFWMVYWQLSIHPAAYQTIAFSQAIDDSIQRVDRFAITSNCYIARCRNDMQINDVICVVVGCEVPLILRPVENHFEVVGEVFVHGIMHGEALKAVENGEKQLEDLELR